MNHRKSAIHYWIRAVILTGFSFYVVYLTGQDSLNYYIAPRMEMYVKLAALGMYAVAAFQAIRGWKEWHLAGAAAIACDCEHHLPKTRVGSIVTYGFFLVPLLLGFFTPDTLLGSTYAAQKGMNFNGTTYSQLQTIPQDRLEEQAASSIDTSITYREPGADSFSSAPANYSIPDANSSESAVPGQGLNEVNNSQSAVQGSDHEGNSKKNHTEDSLAEMFPYDMFTEINAKHAMELYQQEVIEIPEDLFMETLTSLDLYKDNFIGKNMKLSGFIYRAPEMNDEQFAVGRIAMACCAADSMPFGVLAEYPRAAKYEDDTWVEVSGKMDVAEFNGYEIILLKVISVERIDEPESPYVYPNYEFGLS